MKIIPFFFDKLCRLAAIFNEAFLHDD
ncbi:MULTISPECIES: protein YrbN [Candidatus Williamhamiltonella]|nr:protein YrbN [Candidatus Hamiltonella defensa]